MATMEAFTCLRDSDAADALIRWIVMPSPTKLGDGASNVLRLGSNAVDLDVHSDGDDSAFKLDHRSTDCDGVRRYLE